MTKQLYRIFLGTLALAVAVFCLAESASTGQQPAPIPRAVGEPPRKEPDPTVPGPELGKILNTPKDAKVQPKTSDVRLKGRVISKQSALVSLEIDGTTYLLPVGGEARSVRVLEITSAGVRIEVAPRKDIRILH